MLEDLTSRELNLIETEDEMFHKRAFLAELVKGAAESDNPEAAFEFLCSDPTIKAALGNDKSEWPQRAKDLYYSVEGFGTDATKMGAITGGTLAGSGAIAGALIGAAAGGLAGGPVGAIMGLIPGAIAGALVNFFSIQAVTTYIVLGIAMVVYACVVRLKRYKRIMEEVKASGIDQEKMNTKKRYSEYLPLYSDFPAKVKRIEQLKSLCEYAVKNASKLDINKMRSTFSKTGLVIDINGKVKAGKHINWKDTDNSDSITGKGWDAKKLMSACDTMLRLIKVVGSIELSKDNLKNQVPKATFKVLRGALKELNFWLLDLSRGVAMAAKWYKR